MSPDLSRRLADALSAAQPPVLPQQRRAVMDAAEPDTVQTFEDLPDDVQAFINSLEKS